MNAPVSTVESALIELIAQSHRLRPANAARALGIGRGRVQRAIEKLVTQGLAVNIPDPHDGRVHVTCLTDAGQMRALESRRIRSRASNDAPSGMTGAACADPVAPHWRGLLM